MKKGFTLAELLGVIAVLGLLMTIIFVSYTRMNQDADNTIDEAVKTMIIENSKKYIKRHKGSINDGNTYCLTLKDILDDNLMSDPVTNSDGEEIDESTKIKAVIKNNNFEVEVGVSECEEIIIHN